MRYTLLKMTQLILSSMDSDEINSINDTVESQQVVDVIETCYNDLISTLDLPEHWDLFELEPSLDVTRPTVMYLPENVGKIEWIKYDVEPSGSSERNHRLIFPMKRGVFFDRMNMFDTDKTEVYQYDFLVGSETFDVRGLNNTSPTYYTTVDNRTLIFDNYDLSHGTTLMGNRTTCYGQIIPSFQRTDTFVPDLDQKQFTLLFNEAKSQAFAELKQVQNAKAEQRARRGWVHSQKKKSRTDASPIRTWLPDYGRK